MAMKRPPKDNDATMDVSMSQLVVPRPAPPRNNPKNDMSLWGGVMVGTQDFTPEPVRPLAPARPRRRTALLLALFGVAALAGGFFVVRSMTSDDAPAPSAAVTPPAPVATPTPAEPAKPEPAKPEPAKPEPTKPELAVAAVAPTTMETETEVDAISGVAPIIKPAKKKPARKATAKKKKPPAKKKR